MSAPAYRQIAVMAVPVRLQLLALLLSDPDGEAGSSRLAGPAGDPGEVGRHLEEMADVGLLHRVERAPGERVYRPTHDAFARFGALAVTQGSDGDGSGEHDVILDRIVDRLATSFAGTFARPTVDRYVRQSYDLLAARARVRRHLPALTTRFAADRLSALARAEGLPVRTGVDVLFVCVHNSGRSQIAAAALRATAPAEVRVRTAGSAPRDRIDPTVRRILAERGWDSAAEFPKPLTDDVVRASDHVVTMGCGDACPVFPGRRYEDWPVADPGGLPDDGVRAVVADIERRVLDLLGRIALR
ncbi:three-helix bundle dimerization domain-containing protein [Cellulomonas sp. S1-8]|uniref:arsenate reductase/protein-tyrosine-phosphatase family protein n=1 Tax=Cellulomonas sp. S1-8 TaxID=2904790 RepID=UPI002244A3EE|nr:hypothetical protein [Cellulomonas sp. S1-8]UZN02026.1 hypothetical protein OKX07_13125 [Cellulomonas sp. S1-8]